MDRQITINIINIDSIYIDRVDINMKTHSITPHGLIIKDKNTSKLEFDVNSSSENTTKFLKNLHKFGSA